MELSKDLKSKLEKLTFFMKEKKVIVAFSGGVDSSLLAYLSKKNAKETLLITENSILYPKNEINTAKKFAQKYKINLQILNRKPLESEKFRKNPVSRCYLCKKGLYEDIKQVKNSKGFDIIVDGTNIEDCSDFRPGIKALKELSISTPYIDYKIKKQEIRDLCNFFNLDVYSKPSMACFSSRIPYNQPITREKLWRIQKSEEFLKKEFNLKQLRVRHYENRLVRIEFLVEDIPKLINQKNMSLIKNALKNFGFCYITIDIEGFRSGSMNEILTYIEKNDNKNFSRDAFLNES